MLSRKEDTGALVVHDGNPTYSLNSNNVDNFTHYEELDQHKASLSSKKYSNDEIELIFLYQVPIGNKPICASVMNIIDGDMQSSEFGFDVFHPKVQRSMSSGVEDAFDFNTLKPSTQLILCKKLIL